MYKSGLAIITKGLSENNLQYIYSFARKCINNRLYISVKGFSPYNEDWKLNINKCYNIASKICPNLDIRLLLPSSEKGLKDADISVLLCDDASIEYERIKGFISHLLVNVPEILLNFEGIGESISETPRIYESQYSNVCLGGTFDRLHNGHKILLSISALMTREKLYCGVSGEHLIKQKILYELIEPLSTRIDNCLSFLKDIKPNIECTVECINDVFGPTIDNPDFDCIVGSAETKSGCLKINDARSLKGFSKLNIELIELIDEDINFQEISDEKKMSSSKNRVKLLGKMLKSANNIHEPGKPYIIGLTGGIASGKSSIAEKLKSFGAEIIDCDKLGHEAYLPDSDCYNKLIHVYGNAIVNSETRMINRAQLGTIVFNNPLEMKKLTDIVWPTIANLAKMRIHSIEDSMKQQQGNNTKIVVIDAAVLLDAGWETFCNEVWVSFVPRNEAIQRIKNRNNLSEEQATSRINSQKNSKFYVDAANVVFCTLWSYEFTHRQLQKAWDDLIDRIKMRSF